MTGKPTPEAFEKLLTWLDPDPEQAPKKYQKIHSRLISIFAAHGCVDAESLADETIDRVMAKIDWLVENYVGDPTRYFCGVARNVLKEYLRKRLPPDVPITPPNEVDETEQERYNCFDQCMSELPERYQSLVLAYYEDKGQAKIQHRQRLAEEHGISMSALRVRVFHLRVQLSKCLESCLGGHSAR